MERVARLALLAAASLAACRSPVPGAPPVLVSDGRYAMGTVLELTLVARDQERARRTLDEAFALVSALESHLSRYDPESDVSRLNAMAGRGPVAVDESVREVLRLALEGARQTGGAFDVTVGPLVSLWVEAAERDRLPEPEALVRARSLVGSDAVRLREDGRVALLRAGMAVDLGAVGKGYALDRVVALLRERGYDRALLAFGQSSVVALGAPPEASGWRLLLRAPEGDFAGAVRLRDQAFSVSSSLGQWSEIEGRRYGHVIDPRTGHALVRRVQAAVLAPSAGRAEMLSTALVVLDREAGLALVEALPETEALWADASGRTAPSSGWHRAARFELLAADGPG